MAKSEIGPHGAGQLRRTADDLEAGAHEAIPAEKPVCELPPASRFDTVLKLVILPGSGFL